MIAREIEMVSPYVELGGEMVQGECIRKGVRRAIPKKLICDVVSSTDRRLHLYF
jgi:hypothetical protein